VNSWEHLGGCVFAPASQGFELVVQPDADPPAYPVRLPFSYAGVHRVRTSRNAVIKNPRLGTGKSSRSKQVLRDVDAVGGGPFAQVIGNDPEVKRPGMGLVLPDTAHVHVVGSGGGDGHGTDATDGIIGQHDSRVAGQQLPVLCPGKTLAGLHHYRHVVAPVRQHPHHGGAGVQLGQVQDLPGLSHELALFTVTLLVIETVDMGQ